MARHSRLNEPRMLDELRQEAIEVTAIIAAWIKIGPSTYLGPVKILEAIKNREVYQMRYDNECDIKRNGVCAALTSTSLRKILGTK